VLLAGGLALALVACRGSAGAGGAKDPYVRLLAHTDRMIQILKDDRSDPDKAARELAAYREKNGAEVEELKQVLGDFMQRDPMKAAAVSAVYGLKSAELATLTEELAAKTRAR
jgi:hypothetical protein